MIVAEYRIIAAGFGGFRQTHTIEASMGAAVIEAYPVWRIADHRVHGLQLRCDFQAVSEVERRP